MQALLLVIHVLLAVSLIALVLIQHGRGADAGAAFGSGASATVFGARGSASFLTKITTLLAIGFFANSLALAYMSASQPEEASLMERVRIEQSESDAGAANTATPVVSPSDVPQPGDDEAKAESSAKNTGQPSDVPDVAE